MLHHQLLDSDSIFECLIAYLGSDSHDFILQQSRSEYGMLLTQFKFKPSILVLARSLSTTLVRETTFICGK